MATKKPRLLGVLASFCMAAGSLLPAPVLLSGCATGPGNAVQRPALVPAEALAALVIGDPAALLQSLSRQWSLAGLSETAGSDPKAAFEKLLPFAAEAESIIDPGRPWVLLLMPGRETNATRPVIELPFTGDPTTFLASASAAGLVEVARAEGYLVLAQEEGSLEFPPAKPADLSLLDRWPAASLALWVGAGGLDRAEALLGSALGGPESGAESEAGYWKSAAEAGADERPLGRSFRALLASKGEAARARGVAGNFDALLAGGDEAAGTDQGESASVKASLLAATATEALFSGVEEISAALVPTRDGLVLRCAFRATKGSQFASLLAKEASAPSALPWTARLPADSLLAASWSFDPAFSASLATLSNGLVQSLVPALAALSGAQGEATAELDALMSDSLADSERWVAALGTRGALSFDLDPAGLSKALAASSGDRAAALAASAGAIPRLRYVAELRKAGEASALLAESPDSKVLAPLLAAMSELGMGPVSLSTQARSKDGFNWSELQPSLGEAADPDLEPLVASLTPRWSVSPNRLALTNEAADALVGLAQGRAAKSLASSPGFTGFARSMPQRAQYVVALSARRLAEIAAPLAAGSGAGRLEPSRYGTWVAWALAEAPPRGGAPGGGSTSPLLEFGLGLPASDLGALAAMAKELIPASKDSHDD